MNNSEIQKMNEKIAMFDGCEKPTHVPGIVFKKNGYLYPRTFFKYHEDWALLMPVIWKIEAMDNGRFGFTVDPWSIVIIDYMNEENEIVNISREYEHGDDKNETAKMYYYEAVTKFLNWYEKNKQS